MEKKHISSSGIEKNIDNSVFLILSVTSTVQTNEDLGD